MPSQWNEPSEAAKTTLVKIYPLSSLAYRDYRLFLTSSVMGQLGQQMRQFANIYQVYELTHSPLQLGLTGLFQALPLFTLGFFAGAIADKFDRRKLVMLTQALNLVLAVVLALLTATGAIKVWHIYIITTLTSAINAFGQPARMSMVPGLIPRTHVMNAVTLNIALGQSSSIFGPAAAGYVVALAGISTAYFVNAVMFLPSLIALAFMRSQIAEGGGRQPLSRQVFAEGVKWVVSSRVILGLLLFDAALNLFGNYRNIMPIMAIDVLGVGTTGLGKLLSAPSVGAIMGTVTLLALGNVRRKGLMAILSTVFYAVGLILFGLSHWFLISLILVGCLGFFDSLSMSVRHTTLQIVTPDRLRGRASSVMQVFTGGMPALGALIVGATTTVVGAPNAMVLGGIVIAMVAVALSIVWREVRQFRS